MNAMYANLESCGFSLFLDHYFDFFLRLLYHLFDSGRMNTSVHDQLLQRDSRYLTTNRIKSGQNYCFRCIINDQVYTCHGLKGADIASLTSDDTSLHLIIR